MKKILIITLISLLVLIGGIFIIILSKDNVTNSALSIGDKAPEFSGIDNNGIEISLNNLLEKGPVVLIFYRGYWCPYCNKHLSKLQDSLDYIIQQGVSVVAISPEKGEFIGKTVQQTKASFSILSDVNYSIMKEYKLDYIVSTPKVVTYKIFKMNINKANGDNSNILPVPATYIIGTDGNIKWVHFNPDYKERSSIKEILNQL